MSRRRQRQSKTFRQIQRETTLAANESLMRRATAASSLAKWTRGEVRGRLYDQKHRALRQLLMRGGVIARVDLTRHHGLLSVGLDSVGRLHTHESWMRDARIDYRKTEEEC